MTHPSTPRWRRPFGPTLVAAAALALCFTPTSAVAKVFHSKKAALRLAFPGADSFTNYNFFLTRKQRDIVQRWSASTVGSRMITIYVGTKNGKCLGYAYLDTHRVRTLPETILTVLTPKGKVNSVHILAFFEPQNYMPNRRWLKQFRGRRLSRSLQVSYDIAGIAGSTMSAHAVTKAARRVLALHKLLLATDQYTVCRSRAVHASRD